MNFLLTIKNLADMAELFQQILALPESERLQIAIMILQSLSPQELSVEDWQLGAAKEAAEELDSGEVQGIPAREVHTRMQQRIRKQ